MVQPGVSDPTAALLAFSKSFKKVRRAETVKQTRYAEERNVEHLSIYKDTRIRSTSLPNFEDLYIVVRDNDKRQSLGKLSTLSKAKICKNFYEKYQFTSPIMQPLHSSSFVCNYPTKDYFGRYLQTSGSIITVDPNGIDDNTTKLLKSTLMLFTKLNLSDRMKRHHKVS